MAEKHMNAVLRLRRDRSFAYERLQSFIPRDGEVCIVDTSREGIRIKIGDGMTQYKQLPYVDFGIVLRGYLHEGSFYPNRNYLEEEKLDTTASIYIDRVQDKIYYYDENQYKEIGVNAPNASADTPGIMKLYDTWNGLASDGSVTQEALKEKFDEIDGRLQEMKQKLDNQKIIIDPNNVIDDEMVEFHGFNWEVVE